MTPSVSRSGFYDDAIAHLADEVKRVRTRLRLRITIERARGRLPRRADLLDRGYVSADAVDAALEDGEVADPASGNTIERWHAACAALDQEIEQHLARSREVGGRLPIPALFERFGLSRSARDMLWLAIAVEVDAGTRIALAYLQNDITRQFADLQVFVALFCDGIRSEITARRELAPEAPLFGEGLLVMPPEALLDEASVLRMPLRASRRIVDLACGVTAPDPILRGAARLDRCPPGASPLDWMVMAPDELARQRAFIDRVAALTDKGEPPVVLLLGPDGAGKSTLSWALGQRLGLSVLRVAVADLDRERLPPPHLFWPRVLREGRLQDVLVLIDGVDRMAPDELASLARAVDRRPAVAVALEARDAVQWPGNRSLTRLELGLPGHAERARVWHNELQRAGVAPEMASSLAAKFRVTAGVVKRTVDEVTGAGTVVTQRFADAVHQRLAESREHRLGTLATRITSRPSWDDLVLPRETGMALERLAAQFRHRTKLMVDWGFERRMSTGLGISALFQGPPGTGKTMAASVIAGIFDLELFQVDLSRIVSKWLGETEKNLATIFDEAEKAHAILLFDEADSLFAKRTDVQSSHDRHANLEVNFLLQKMDRFQGITLLTSNFGSSIDEAFVRRISFRIDFPAPGHLERARLWESLIPPELPLAEEIDCELLGTRFEMSGGHIRNAIFKAAINAAAQNTLVAMTHLIDAANIEYRAMGKIVRVGAEPGP